VYFLSADFTYQVGFDGVGFVVPFAADVGEDGGDLVVVEVGEAGHFEAEGNAGDDERAGDAVHEDAREARGRAEDVFGIEEGRGEAILAEAIGLMAGSADVGVNYFALVEARLLADGERPG